MSQYDFGTIDPYVVDGVELSNMLNQWRDALYTMQRGPTRPLFVVPGQMWVNDSAGPTNWKVQLYMSPTVGDVTIFEYDTTSGYIQWSGALVGGPFLPLDGSVAMTGTLTAPQVDASKDVSPLVRWLASANPADMKRWHSYLWGDGTLLFDRINDAGNPVSRVTFRPDGLIETIAPPVEAAAQELVNAAWVRALLASGGGGSKVHVGLTPPANPSNGDQWFYNDGSAGGGAMYVYYDDGNSQQWIPATPTGRGSGILKSLYAEYTSAALLSATMPHTTVPQITQGTQILAATITPAATSRIRLSFRGSWAVSNAAAAGLVVGLFQSGVTPALRSVFLNADTNDSIRDATVMVEVPAGSAAERTYSVRVGPNAAASITMNGVSGTNYPGGNAACTLTAEEIA